MSIKESDAPESISGAIDTNDNVDSVCSALYTNATKHPFVTGGVVLVAAGLAYAIVRAVKKTEEHAEVAREVHLEVSIAIQRSPAELYSFWRNLENLPLFMKNLESVIELDGRRSRWVAKTINGVRVEWDAEIYNEKENELIAWRSLENADVVNAGSVRFQPGPKDHGTYVRVTVNYNPPAGKVGATVAQLLGTEPSQLIKEDLRRFKQLMEAGEVPTVTGQSSGRAKVTEAAIKSGAAGMEKAEGAGESAMTQTA